MTTLNRTVTKNSTLTSPTSVVLEDPTGTYGVRREDTSAVVVASGTAMDEVSAGVYQYEFTDPAYDLIYKYYVKITDGSQVNYFSFLVTGPLSDSSNLISLADAKLYMGITGTTNDDLINALITQASNMIKKELSTDIVQTNYTNESYNGYGDATLYLENYPIVSVMRANVSTESAMWVKNTGGLSHATAEVTGASIKLHETSAGVWSTTTVSFSSYPTITQIVSYINTLSNWSAGAYSTYGAYPSTELVTAPARDADNVLVALCVPDKCENDYEIKDVANACLYNPYGWSCGVSNIFISYTAGYDPIPDAIQSACEELVKLMYDASKSDSTYNKEVIGDYEYSKGSWLGGIFGSYKTGGMAGVSSTVMIKLTPYKRILFW